MGDWLPEMPATPSDDDPALHSPTLTPYSWLGANDDGFLVPLFQAQMETSPGNSLLAADASSVKGGRRELSFAGMQYTISSDGDDSDSQLSTISVAPRRKLTDSGPRSRKRPRRAAKAAAAAKFNAHFALTGNQSTRQQVLPSSSLPSTPVPPLSPSSPDRRLQQLLDHSLRRPSSDLRATRQSEPSIMPAQTSSSTPAKRPYRTRRKAATTTKKPTAATKPMVTSSSAEPTTTVKPFVTSSGGKPTTEDEKVMRSLRSTPTPINALLRGYSRIQIHFPTHPDIDTICIKTTDRTPVPADFVAENIGAEIVHWGVLTDEAITVASEREGVDGELDREVLVRKAIAQGHAVVTGKGKHKGVNEHVVVRMEREDEGHGGEIAIDFYERVDEDEEDSPDDGDDADLEDEDGQL